ncbi:MAG: beta-ketoacyl-ACP synthase III [Rubricoccaceae bacterium]
MNRLHAALTGWGHYAPERVVTNDDLAQIIDTSDEWIRTRSGIEQRHFVREDQATSHLCVEAGRRALARAGVEAADVDLVLVATSSPDYLTPPVSSQVQHALGATRAGAMTLLVGCTGFVYGLVTAEQFIRAGACETILLIGAEVISKNLDFEDRTTCVLFGDGAGAVVLQATEADCGLRAFELGSDGAGAEAVIAYSPGTAEPVSQKVVDERRHYLRMNGREVFKFATTTMGASLARVMQKAGLSPEDIALFVPHQANARIIEYAAETLRLPPEKVVMNVARYGNTSAASIPIALSEALSEGRARVGDTLALVGFGAGLTWATALFTLGPAAALERARPAGGTRTERNGTEGEGTRDNGTPDSVVGPQGEVQGLIA